MVNRRCVEAFCRLRRQNILLRGCVKRFFTALRAELYFERRVIFTISRSEIMKNTSVSNLNLARSAMKILFTQPHNRIGPGGASLMHRHYCYVQGSRKMRFFRPQENFLGYRSGFCGRRKERNIQKDRFLEYCAITGIIWPLSGPEFYLPIRSL
jgi:hypothetical protein